MAINETKIRNNISAQVKNQIAQQKQSINNTLKIQKGQYDETINRNKSYLNEQIGSLKKDKNISDDRIQTLQNRRGGFYSGGMDYQLAENAKTNLNAQTAITRDITDKNNSVLSEYNTLARQAAENIRLLETQAPDKIRELVNQELTRQRGIQMEEERLKIEKDRFALEKRLKELQMAEAKRKRSEGSRSRKSSGTTTSKKSTSIANQYRGAAKQSQKTSQDRYYESKMAQLNEGRSLARKPIQELYPGLVPDYRTDKSLSYYDRNKILLDSLRGR